MPVQQTANKDIGKTRQQHFEKSQAVIKGLVDRGFYGRVELIFRSGIVVKLDKIESIKVE